MKELLKLLGEKERSVGVATHGEGGAESDSAVVSFDVSEWGIETDRIVVIFDGMKNDLFSGRAKGNGIVVHVGHRTDDKTFKAREFATAFEVLHHAVDVVEIFVEIFDEKDFTVGVDIARRRTKTVENG